MTLRLAPRSSRAADLREQREHLGVSRRYAAHVSGYSRHYIAALETGGEPLPIDTAATLDQTYARIRARFGAARRRAA